MTLPHAAPVCLVIPILALGLAPRAIAADPPANIWVKTNAVIEGRRWDVPAGFDPVAKRFLVLGGRRSQADDRKPRSYDVLSLDAPHRFRNELPADAKWGAETGAIDAPTWKDERWGFRDLAGNTRPNWIVYGTFSLGQKYDYDPDTKAYYFYAGGSTFRYDPAKREWKDLAPPTHPEKVLGGILLWSSMCYDQSAKKFVLFGGGNVQSDPGDPGTWTYSVADNRWEQIETVNRPPSRANARLVYDPVNRKVVLFGGDQLNQLTADTWVFDSAKRAWEERKPGLSPRPRGGQALLWLPKAQKILLLGGYTYTSTTDYVARLYQPMPLEAWTYDVATNKWEVVAQWEKDAPVGPSNVFLSAAVDDTDTVFVLDAQNRAWTCRLDASKPDAAAKIRLGVYPGVTAYRTDSHDPKWYRKAESTDPAVVAARLKALRPNMWTVEPVLRTPGMNMDWGSAVFDPAHDQIVRFSGGHSAYSGTAPFVYDVKTARYSLPFAPEYPLEYVYSNDQVHGEWSFAGNPWMTGHTYKSTGYDPNLKCLVFAPHEFTYFFDSIAGSWSRSPGKNPYRPNFYVTTVCSTPTGAVVWADAREGGRAGLWRLDATDRAWKPLPVTGELPDKSADRHGMAYDSKRDRMLLFSDNGPKAGNVATYDLKSGTAKWLDPAGADKALVHCRETIYLPDDDLVLIGGRLKNDDGQWRWLAYDCAANAWVGLNLAGDDPVGKAGAFNNSMGLMFDPNRKLVWAVGQYSKVHVLRLDVAMAAATRFK